MTPKMVEISVAVVILLVIIPPLRALLIYLLTSVVHPAIVELIKHTTKWIVYFVKTLFYSHWTILKNMTTPRKLIYPDLKRELAEERKKRLTPNL